MDRETIAAISTAPGASGIGIIRVSGPEAIEIADKVFKSYKDIKLADVDTHTAHFGCIKDGDHVIDEVLVLVMKDGRSFTGENQSLAGSH